MGVIAGSSEHGFTAGWEPMRVVDQLAEDEVLLVDWGYDRVHAFAACKLVSFSHLIELELGDVILRVS